MARGLGEVRAALEYLPSLRLSEAAQAEARFYLQGKERDFINAMVLAAGVVVDFLADDEIVTPGQPFAVSVNAYGITPKSVRFDAPKGWAAVEKKVTSAITPRDMRVAWQADYTVTVPADAAPTQPYWLRQPRRGDAFAPGDGMTGIEPLAPPALRAVVEFDIEGERVAVTRPVQYRYADKALGEVRRDLKVAPAVSVVTAPGILIFPEADAAAAAREVTVTLTNHDRQGSAGKLKLEAPAGWRVTPAEADFALKREGEQASYRFQVNAPAQIAPGNYDLQAVATVGNQPYTIGYQALAYPHIEPRWVYRPAKVVAEVFDVKVAPDLRVGYVEGAGDGFDEALRRLGVNVQTVTPAELAAGDLSRYDCIVLGVRVYEVRPDVIANNARLLDYARRGGVLIAQYNKAEYAAGNFAPYPVKMARTPDRVTDERAAVTVLDPAHPLFNFPNKITARDFEGWVQERGTYFLNEWDAQYKPLLASNDAGEAPQRGGQLIAPVGEGYYVYTGYAWFRQLPEGVPGAYRLVANLVSFPKAVKRKT